MRSQTAARPTTKGSRLTLLGFVLAAVFSTSCVAMPPVTPGYVTTQRSEPGRVLAGAQGGVAATLPGTHAVAGVMHLEPFVTEDSSIPLDATMQRPVGDEHGRNTRVLTRVGYRTRVDGPRFAVGLGAGANYLLYEPAEAGGGRDDHIEPGLSGFGFEVGAELAYEFRSRYVGVSFAGRPCVTWNHAAYTAFWTVPEITGAVFITENLGLTFSLVGGGAAVFVTDRQDLGFKSHENDGLGLAFTGQLLFGIVWTQAPRQDEPAPLLGQPQTGW